MPDQTHPGPKSLIGDRHTPDRRPIEDRNALLETLHFPICY